MRLVLTLKRVCTRSLRPLPQVQCYDPQRCGDQVGDGAALHQIWVRMKPGVLFVEGEDVDVLSGLAKEASEDDGQALGAPPPRGTLRLVKQPR